MIYFGPITEATRTEDHLIMITSQPDGIHVSMTDNVAEVIKYPNGDVKVIGKQHTTKKPYWTLSGHDGHASMINSFTGEQEEFNTADAWLKAAEAAGITTQEG